MIDEVDRRILELLQQNARTPIAEIARQLDMAPSAIHERIRKLEEREVILGYAAQIAPGVVGRPLLAFVFVRATDRVGGTWTGDRLAEIPEVQEVHHVAGEDCFLVKIRAADTESLGRLLREQFGAIESVTSTRTTIVLGTLKETLQLPITSSAQERRGDA